jgi:serine phosphatase RsbU (regulator of sigma subunit)
LEIVRKYRAETPAQIASRVFELLDEWTGEVSPKDDLTLVILKS